MINKKLQNKPFSIVRLFGELGWRMAQFEMQAQHPFHPKKTWVRRKWLLTGRKRLGFSSW